MLLPSLMVTTVWSLPSSSTTLWTDPPNLSLTPCVSMITSTSLSMSGGSSHLLNSSVLMLTSSILDDSNAYPQWISTFLMNPFCLASLFAMSPSSWFAICITRIYVSGFLSSCCLTSAGISSLTPSLNSSRILLAYLSALSFESTVIVSNLLSSTSSSCMMWICSSSSPFCVSRSLFSLRISTRSTICLLHPWSSILDATHPLFWSSDRLS